MIKKQAAEQKKENRRDYIKESFVVNTNINLVIICIYERTFKQMEIPELILGASIVALFVCRNAACKGFRTDRFEEDGFEVP